MHLVRLIAAAGIAALLSACGDGHEWSNDLERCERIRNTMEAEPSCAAAVADEKLTPASRARAYYMYSVVLMELERYREGTDAADRAIALGRTNAATYNQRAWGRYRLGDAAGALPDAETAVQLDPRNSFALETRAWIYTALGRRADAIRDFRAALAIDPANMTAQDGLRQVEVR